MDEDTRDELSDYLSTTPMQWAVLSDGRYVLAFPDEEMADFVSGVLWHQYGLTFTLHNDAPVACLLIPVSH